MDVKTGKHEVVTQDSLTVGDTPLAPRRMMEIAPVNPDDYRWKNPSELRGKPLKLVDFEFREGQWGKYTVMEVVEAPAGQLHSVATGSKMILDQLRRINIETELPIEFTFKVENKAYYMG